MKKVILTAAVIVLAGCSGVVQTVKYLQTKDPVICQQIKPGVTTVEQVETESMLGKPSGIEFTKDGGETRTYGSFTVKYKNGKVTEFACKK